MVERLEAGGIFGTVDVDVDIGVAGYFEGVIKFEAYAAGHGKSGHEQIDVGRSVGGADLDGLLVGGAAGT